MRSYKSQKGISLIITFFIMIILLAVVLSISIILYSEIRVIRNMGDSVISFYAAESGIEKVLFYDRQALPTRGDPCTVVTDCTDIGTIYPICSGNGLCVTPPTGQSTTSRGLCAMFETSPVPHCTEGVNGETSVFCNPVAGLDKISPTGANGCDIDNCNNCQITFSADFMEDDGITKDGRSYTVVASVVPGRYLDVKSNGTYGTAQRKIEITMTTPL